jgi:transcriptional regulator
MAQKIENIMQLSNDKISEITMYARDKVKQQHNSLKMINDMESLYKEVYERN